MILNLVLWYLVLAAAGWLVFPLAFRLLAFLPDRGFTAARPLGLLLWGYTYWLLTCLHVLQNDSGGVLLALVLVTSLSVFRLLRGSREELFTWLRANGRLVITSELLFLAAFALWAAVRAADPNISGTEKPMEMAFINSILRSPVFPPADPWLSGYGISYYYFGYVMVAMLARFTATPGAIAFNLALASWFALTALAAYGLVYNLLVSRGRQIAGAAWALAAPLFAPLFMLLISNLEGFLEVLHARGIFWQPGGQSAFWSWLNIQELTQPPSPPLGWAPERAGGIWWWRASRVLQDFDLNRQSREIIDEFPAFSYLLGDLHPHVLAMPFVLLAIGMALNVYLRLRQGAENTLRLEQWWKTLEFWLAALALGGLSFLNTWDFPIYLALFAAAVCLARFAWTGWRWELAVTFLEVAIALVVAGVVLYLPFYLGFASQASGILPSLIFFTRGVYFWLMFAPLLLPILAWLIWLAWQRFRSGRAPALGQGALFAVGLVGGLWLLSMLLGVRILGKDAGLAGIYGAQPGAPLLAETISRRLAAPGTWITLLVLMAVVAGLIQSYRSRAEERDAAALDAPETYVESEIQVPFVLLLVLLGVGLTLFPEFFYLRDQFGWRMNTIFKFYFQAWIVWAIAGAYTSAVLWQALRKAWQALVFRLGWVVLALMALTYFWFGIRTFTSNFAPAEWTLDGSAYLARYSAEDMEAIRWMQNAPYGVVAEAVGGSYTGYARVSTFSGQPAVLGWPGHELQWRGGADEIGSREPDTSLLYKARSWEQVSAIINKYRIRYVYVGPLERSLYRPNDELLQQNLGTVFHNSQVTIYEVPSYDSQRGQAELP